MPLPDTGVNTALTASAGYGRRPNPVYSEAYEAVRAVLISARRERGLSQRALAARLGKSGSHVAMIECGQRRVDLLEFCRIAESLEVPPETLVRRIAAQLDALEA